MARIIAERVDRSTYEEWRKRVQLMAASPFSWPYSATWYKCGEYYAVKIQFPEDSDTSIVMLALQNYGQNEKFFYADVERLQAFWKNYLDVLRVLRELGEAGEL